MDDQPQVPTPPLEYEETPIIEPQPSTQEPPHQPEPPRKKSSLVGFLKGLLFFIILFGIGFALSGYVRNFLSTTASVPTTTTPSPPANPEQTTTDLESSPSGLIPISSTPSATPKTYGVLNGLTRKAVENISFTLPASVLPPVCDGSACGSQGTYLPGGTRFTVAARGAGQVLADFRGKVISDAGGKPFTINQTTIAGKPATEFTTAMVGSTIGGYAFSKMHGYMIEISETMSLEINHFSPSGITADFASDETVFATIVRSLTFTGGEKGGVIPTGTTQISPTVAPLR